MIVTSGLGKTYSDGTVALSSFSASFARKRTCLLGRNGAGKTTLLRILSTQLLPSSGSAQIDGLDVVRQANEVRKMICSIPQEAQTVGMASPLEHVAMYLTARGASLSSAVGEAKKVLSRLELSDRMDKPTDELSGGMKRKVFVAMAIASGADVVFLDEPTVGLDPISRMSVWQAIRALDAQLILTTHYMEEAEELCEEIALIDEGRLLAQGTKDELMAPIRGKLRVEGIGKIRVGATRISYVDSDKAGEYLGRATIRPVGLEDLMILKGAQPLEVSEEDAGESESRG
ncbi:MAG: ABC transporter ATP-binding protein [TACK group archaeon]|nr:ABC transporter ATP-binding protein [TACK group archaeon]